jgi:hypothetical protein
MAGDIGIALMMRDKIAVLDKDKRVTDNFK